MMMAMIMKETVQPTLLELHRVAPPLEEELLLADQHGVAAVIEGAARPAETVSLVVIRGTCMW